MEQVRQTYVYDIPPEVQVNGITSLSVRELTIEEEKMVYRRVGSDIAAAVSELSKQALCEINEQKVSLADGSADKAYDSFSPQLRQLVVTAYTETNNADEKTIKKFQASRRIKVG
jgi:hypothetical protein